MKVLITGASSGIGRDMAKVLAKKGYDLILVARGKEKLEEVKKELQEKNKIKITTIEMDLSNEENCKNLPKIAGDIDILINNAGFGVFGKFTETDLEKELKMIKTNITAMHILGKIYLQEMSKKNRGKILNVASIGGVMPGALMASYYASKAYIVRLSEGIREELKKQKSKVQISVLCPGPVNTNFNNVANVKFNIKGLSSEYVAKYTIEKFLKGKFMIIPGKLMKIAHILCKITPNNIVSKVVYHIQEKKDKNK